MDNSAFEDNPHEVTDILKKIIKKIENEGLSGGLVMDSNGNHIGEWGCY
jgi:hypothetical protein